MKMLKLPKSKLDFFAAVTQQFGEVHAPVKVEGGFAFRRLNRWSEARLDYQRTLLPPKKYFLPPEETLLRYRHPVGYEPCAEDLDRRLVLFGLHPCDIYALNLLDRVFGPPFADPYYAARRRNVAIIGMDCMPDEHCFCSSMRADFVDRGFDLFLSDIGEDYFALVGSARGDDMVLAAGPLFSPVTPADVDQYKRRSAAKRRAFRIEVEIRDLPEIFEMEYESGIWQELGERCLACGSCSMVCPSCYCFDLRDQVALGSPDGARLRRWDSCLFLAHARIAGGENFRRSRAARIKMRYYHKHRGFVAQYGRPSCVGCGRCLAACPAGIAATDVITRLRETRHASPC
ncbi:MAG: 4Fe-4S dicluster domain-containing protein [Bryobacterales bacterium]|nr:4Fe-4S dicluster domain-containing protein [Bryobacterales bacterium]